MNITLYPYAAVILRLLQGVVYQDDPLWDKLLNNQTALIDYFSRIGLTLLIAETDGFAYLKQQEDNDSTQPPLPRLVRRIPLSYSVTLLGVLLREKLDYLENATPDATPIISRDEIHDLIRPFLVERGDERVTHKKIDGWINKVVEIGFLKASGDTHYEIRRILKAKFDSEQLATIKAILTQSDEDVEEDV